MKMFRAERHPPTFIPFCRLCDLPVARLAYRVPRSDQWHIEFEAKCCGKTQGAKITFGEMWRVHQTGEKFYLIVKKGRYQQVAQPAKKVLRVA